MVSVLDATAARWDDIVAVLDTRGDPGRCWCQYFRIRQAAWEAAGHDGNKTALRNQLADPLPPGVIGYNDDGEASGWCAVAPRASYPRLASGLVSSATQDEPGLWAVTCFVVKVGARRRGMVGALLDGAVELARGNGARVVEGYPVDTAARASTSAAVLYHGPLSVFLRAGFVEVARPNPSRPVVRLVLS